MNCGKALDRRDPGGAASVGAFPGGKAPGGGSRRLALADLIRPVADEMCQEHLTRPLAAQQASAYH
jgi:hypothetical protein